MNILLLGSGGREHAFAWKLTQSPLCKKLYVATGNAGTAQIAENLPIKPTDFESLANFCKEKNIQMLVVGNEEPLVAGIWDFFKKRKDLEHIHLIAPSQAGAMLEGSKDFAKQLMFEHQIPTASYHTFGANEFEKALQYIYNHSLPIVLKADGLAAGKGVLICPTYSQAEKTLKEMLLDKKFGKASEKIVIEQFLEGIELSVFVLTDGKNYKILPEAKDYKRIGENDTGLNTGGMGAVSPVPFADKDFMQKVEQKIIVPTLQALQQRNINYVGFLFIGLMKVGNEPYVIEFNCRMGDPETQVVFPRIENDLVELLLATATQKLNEIQLKIKPQTAVTTIVVSQGYPENYETGKEILNLEKIEHALIFHAGTKQENGKLLTNGGRVLALTALADTLPQAIAFSQQAAEKVSFSNKYFRRDIGKDLL
ncbi:MAG: phosphoribosylamine--glycine ligase [Raineya sp.]|nr:phosphoribosylamine--glycine ligase [Raineya sp.]MDW8297196.1 phosphoribosylamine--glycine ligase [Raineya sp.]